MREEKKLPETRKLTNSDPKEQNIRHPEFETPSQRRNRDGKGRGPSGSDGGSNRGRGSNH